MSHVAGDGILEALRKRGADRFDPPRFGFVASLLARATRVPAGAREPLLGRARERALALEAAMDSARQAAEAALTQLSRAGLYVQPAMAEAMAKGEYVEVGRRVKRAFRERRRMRMWLRLPWFAELWEETVPQSGSLLPRAEVLEGEFVEEVPPAPLEVEAQADVSHPLSMFGALTERRLIASTEAARATVAVARAEENVSDQAGPYNAQALAARALTEVAELRPDYAQAIVALLDDLATLNVMLPAQEKKPKRGRRGVRRQR